MSDIVAQGKHYTGRGISIDFGQTTEKKTDFARVAVKIIGGEFDGRVVSRDFYFTGGATEHSVKALKALGCTFPNNDITDVSGFGTRDVNFTVEHETYEKDGETKTIAKIGFINEPPGIRPEAQMTQSQKAALKQRLMGTLAATAKPGNGAPKAGGTPPPF